MQHVLILRCMYVPMSVMLGPWGVPSDVIRKRRARVAWLHGLRTCACRVVTWFALVCVSRGYMVCTRARVAWLHGLRSCACCVVTWFAPVRVSRGYMVCPALVLALPRVAGSASFNAVAFLVIDMNRDK